MWFGVHGNLFGSRKASVVSPTWAATVEDFLLDKQRTCSGETIDLYRRKLTDDRVMAWLSEEGIRSVSDVTPQASRRFQARMQEEGSKPSYIFTYHKIHKTFLRWCAAEGEAIAERVRSMPGPRIPDTEPHTFDAQQIASLLRNARSARDAMVIELFYRTGLRLAELAQLTLDDIVDGPEGPWLHVHGKGRRDRIVPMDTPNYRMSRKLKRYVRHERPDTTPCRALFLAPSSRRPDLVYRPLGREAIKSLLRRLKRQTSIPIHAHALRHTWATEGLRAEVNWEALRKAGGWTSYRMIQRYAHFTGDDIVRAWKRRRD